MNKRAEKISTIEVVAEPKASVFERSKTSQLAKVGLMVGIMASAVALAKANNVDARVDAMARGQAAQIERIGVTTDEILTEDQATADAVAQQMEDDGFNEVRIPVPYTFAGADIANDVTRICTSAWAAERHGLFPVYDLWGYQRDGSVGFMPHGSTMIYKYLTALNQYPNWLSGPNGCVKTIPGYEPLATFGVGLFNEPNYKKFDPNPDPANYANVVARSAVTLQKAEDQLGVQIKIYIGDLNPTNDPVGYINGMAPTIKALGLYGTHFFDEFAFHPYGDSVNMYPAIAKALKNTFGYLPDISYDEYGINSQPGPDKIDLYDKDKLGQPAYTESIRGAMLLKLLKVAVCQIGVNELLNFQLNDNGSDGWQTGLSSPDWTPKTSTPAVIGAMNDAKNGLLANCP